MPDALIYDHARKPIGGHHFPQSPSVLLKAKSLRELLDKIIEYRANNSLPWGNPEAELLEHYRKIAPFLITRTGTEWPSVSTSIRRAEAANQMISRRPQMLPANDPLIMVRRRECAECPYLDRDPIDTTELYVKKAARRAILLATDSDAFRRGFCEHHYQFISLLTAAAEPSQQALQPIPQVCWIEPR